MAEEKGIVTKIFDKIGFSEIAKDRVKFCVFWVGLLVTVMAIFAMLIFKETSFSEVIGDGEFTSKVQEANEAEFKNINSRLDSHDQEFKEIKRILVNGYKKDD